MSICAKVDHDRAMADYEAALAADFRSPYVLLGMGVAHIALGDVEKGNALITEAYNELTDEQIAAADPQLADLLARAEEQLAAHR